MRKLRSIFAGGFLGFLFSFLLIAVSGCDKTRRTHNFSTLIVEKEVEGKPVVSVKVTCQNGSNNTLTIELRNRDEIKAYRHQLETVLKSLETAEKVMVQNEQD